MTKHFLGYRHIFSSRSSSFPKPTQLSVFRPNPHLRVIIASGHILADQFSLWVSSQVSWFNQPKSGHQVQALPTPLKISTTTHYTIGIT